MAAQIHSFPRQIAKDHTVTAAILFQFLAYKTRRSKNYKQGKRWFYDSGSKISKRYEYIKPSTILENVRILENASLLEICCFNKMKADKTLWYHVPDEHLAAAEEHRIRFKRDDAQKHGVLAAVLLFNLRHWLKKRLRKIEGIAVLHKMSPLRLSEDLPFSKSAIKMTLGMLVDQGVIMKPNKNKPEYALPEHQMRNLKRGAMLN